MFVVLLLDVDRYSQFINLIDAPENVSRNIPSLYDEFLAQAERDPEADESVATEELADEFANWLCEYHGCKTLTDKERILVYLNSVVS